MIRDPDMIIQSDLSAPDCLEGLELVWVMFENCPSKSKLCRRMDDPSIQPDFQAGPNLGVLMQPHRHQLLQRTRVYSISWPADHKSSKSFNFEAKLMTKTQCTVNSNSTLSISIKDGPAFLGLHAGEMLIHEPRHEVETFRGWQWFGRLSTVNGQMTMWPMARNTATLTSCTQKNIVNATRIHYLSCTTSI